MNTPFTEDQKYMTFKAASQQKKGSCGSACKTSCSSSLNFQPHRSLGRIEDDHCAVTQREVEAHKPLKYYTTNYYDKDFQKVSEKGINFSDGLGIPSCSIDSDTHLKRSANTTMNLPLTLPALPLATTPAKTVGFGQGDVDTEQHLRSRSDSFNSRNSCRPREDDFHLRKFQIFNDSCRKPQVIKHTVQKNHTYRGGVDTRQECSNII